MAAAESEADSQSRLSDSEFSQQCTPVCTKSRVHVLRGNLQTLITSLQAQQALLSRAHARLYRSQTAEPTDTGSKNSDHQLILRLQKRVREAEQVRPHHTLLQAGMQLSVHDTLTGNADITADAFEHFPASLSACFSHADCGEPQHCHRAAHHTAG